jgi:hypothetical protein
MNLRTLFVRTLAPTCVPMILLSGAGLARAQPAASPREITATIRIDMTATVEAVDKQTRTVTVRRESGEVKTLEVPPEVRNFEQVEVGDRVRAEYVDAVAVSLGRPGEPLGSADTSVVTVAPAGAKPGATSVRTRVVAATITALDKEQRLVTLQGPLGNRRTIHLDAGVDIGRINVGDNVQVRHTEATMLAVEKAP